MSFRFAASLVFLAMIIIGSLGKRHLRKKSRNTDNE